MRCVNYDTEGVLFRGPFLRLSMDSVITVVSVAALVAPLFFQSLHP